MIEINFNIGICRLQIIKLNYKVNLLSKSCRVNGEPNSLLIETIISADGNISDLVASRKRSIHVNFIYGIYIYI